MRFLRDSRTKNHNDPQNRKQGVKNDPLPFLWKSQVFGPHKQNNDISHDIDYQELQTFMIRPNTDPFISYNFDLHLFCKIECSVLQAV